MISQLHATRFALLACLALGLAAPSVRAAEPPNWKGHLTGSTQPAGDVDVDAFGGKSSQLGRFTAEGFHVLNPVDFTFTGVAVWTAANGDELWVTFTGQIFPSDDPDFPFGVVGFLDVDGGTGRFAHGRGRSAMNGGFTGVPGDFYLDFQGTLRHPGK
jgi:hypothetical protein